MIHKLRKVHEAIYYNRTINFGNVVHVCMYILCICNVQCMSMCVCVCVCVCVCLSVCMCMCV